MKIATLIISLTFLSLLSYSQVIPQYRWPDWSHAGYQGQIPKPATVLDVTNFGAGRNADNYSSIMAAIDSLHGHAGVIYFPTGVYIIEEQLTLPDSVVLRGASADSTTLILNLQGQPVNGLEISQPNQDSIFTPITNGYYRGSGQITVADASAFSPNDWAEIVEDNGPWDVVPVSYSVNSVGQMVQISAVNGNQLTLQQPLRINYDPSLNVRVRKIVPISNVGIECMKITRVDSPASGQGYNLHFAYAVNCWVSGVESDTSVAAHLLAEYCSHISIKGSYFHQAYLYDGVATHGYGICFRQHTGDCLVENNLFRVLRHAMMVKEGANGNVFSYNYSREPNRSEPISNYSPDICLHGDFAYSNLFEGNVVQNVGIDQTWGPSGPFNTLFRNRVELFGIIETPEDTFNTDSLNVVGNYVTDTGLFMGSFSLAGYGHLSYDNDVQGAVQPEGSNDLSDSTYFYASKPYFWDVNNSWPLDSGTIIPAEQRFINMNGLTLCADTIATSTQQTDTTTTTGISNKASNDNASVYPNPFDRDIIIQLASSENGFADLILTDVTGKILNHLKEKINVGNNQLILETGDQLSSGIYFLKISDTNGTVTRKMIRN